MILSEDDNVQMHFSTETDVLDKVRKGWRSDISFFQTTKVKECRAKQDFVLTTPGISHAVSRLLCSGSQ